jgi:hypothetical protein
MKWQTWDFTASCWKSDQSMHIRWNVTWLLDQYGAIDKIGDETLRRDYVTNFLDNACILLNLDNKNAPITSNLVERYYLDWNDRIGDLKCRMDKEAREADTTARGL